MYQRTLFALFVIVALTVQGCSMAPKTGTVVEPSGTNTMVETTTVETSTVVETTTGSTPTPTAEPVATQSINGTFQLSTTYEVPGGEQESLNAKVTIANNVITAVEAKNVAILPKSVGFQDKFIAGIAGQIVGKNIKDVQVTHVNGSSLTAKAFDRALHELE